MDYFTKFRIEIRHMLRCGWRIKGKTKRNLSLIYRNGMEISIKYEDEGYILEGYLLSAKQLSVGALQKAEEELSIARLCFDPGSWGFVIIAYLELDKNIDGDEFLNKLGYFTTDLYSLAGDVEN